MNVAVIGASNKPDRYSYKAVYALQTAGHTVFAVHPRIKDIDGIPVYSSIVDIFQDIDTISLYVSADTSSAMADMLIQKKPRRIIFNPGAENPTLAVRAEQNGIESLNACTLMLLKIGRF